MPSGFTGLLVLLLAGVPGYLYVFCYERRTPRDALSAGREAVELFAVGALATVAATLVALSLAELWSGLLPLAALGAGWDHVLRHPGQVLASSGLVLSLSAGLCAGLGHLLGSRSAFARRHRVLAGTVWHGVLTDPCVLRRPGEPSVETRRFVAVHLTDGLRVEGYLERVSQHAETAMRDIALSRPIALTPPGGTRQPSSATTAIVPGALVRLIETGPPPVPAPAPPAA
ncbi:DUF6338 family protein [Streptomyces cinnamoneus]|uniref:DUF6338 family protein n=1 Tax=Streptomyces cinnamoneus TaxID=53446 RepID=UPI0033DF0DA3